MTKQEIIEHCRLSVIPVHAGNSLGSGCYVKDFGLFVTTACLVRKSPSVRLTSERYGRVTARVVYRDETTDIAFLELPPALPAPGLALAEGDAPQFGETVYAVNCLTSGWPSVYPGTVEQASIHTNGAPMIRTKGIPWPDANDGALLDGAGNLLGLTKCDMVKNKPNGYAIPVSVLRAAYLAYQPHQGELAVRCPSCRAIVLPGDGQPTATCNGCGTEIKMPVPQPTAPLTGMPGVIEEAMSRLGMDVIASRDDINSWHIADTGTCIWLNWGPYRHQAFAFTHLCNLPADNDAIPGLYRYLLEENRGMGEFSFYMVHAKVELRYRFERPEMDAQHWYGVLHRLVTTVRHYTPLLKKKFGCRDIMFQ